MSTDMFRFDRKNLVRQGLLQIGQHCQIGEGVIFDPRDQQGSKIPIVLGDHSRILHAAIIYGGVEVGEGAIVEEGVILGKCEFGYAVGVIYEGAGARTAVGSGVVLRSRSVVYSGVSIAENSTVGHGTLLRSHVSIGRESQLAHGMTVERKTRIGDYVRCSPLSHITSEVVMEDRVFLGAGILTINDKHMLWKQEDVKPELLPPYFEFGAKVGSGSTIAAGVRIGREAIIGSGSLVTSSIPAGAIAYGVPAKVRRYQQR